MKSIIFSKGMEVNFKRFFRSLLTVRVGLSLVLHPTQVQRANFVSVLDKILQKRHNFPRIFDIWTFHQYFANMSTTCKTKLPDPAVEFWW